MGRVVRCLAALWVCFALGWADEFPDGQAKAIPFEQLGAEGQKQYSGDGIGIAPTATGVRLKAVFQRLEGDATPDGLWLRSTADEDAGTDARFRIRATAISKSTSTPETLPDTGKVHVSKDAAIWIRPGLLEEYTSSMDGIRQDFVVPIRPPGDEELFVSLELTGVRGEPAANAAKLTVEATGRELAYSRLHVTDATGRELEARLEVVNTTRMEVRVDDRGAVYPVRIDPTFSDADWVSMGGFPGTDGSVYAIAADGEGNVYIGGEFTIAGTVFANKIAKWNGSTWSALGSGMNGDVRALAASGSDLYVGGQFTTAGGTSASRIAKWDGSTWSPLGSGMNSVVRALAVSGNDLYAGGAFTTAGGLSANYVAKWNGSAWSPLGSGLNHGVHALAASSGGDLYVGGEFTTAGGTSANRIAKWNGSTWSTLGVGTNSVVWALAVSGGDLYAGGAFTSAGGGSANYIAKWTGSTWSALGSGMAGGNFVTALAVSGSDLYAGGRFTTAGGVNANYVAKWNGSAWSALGSGMHHYVDALAVSSGVLYAGGRFFATVGEERASRIAKWNGSEWSALGSGIAGSVGGGPVNALAVSGGDLYAGGDFTEVGGLEVNYIARWNGNKWSALGSGVNGPVQALAVSGGDLYAGGLFTTASGISARRVAKWDGSAWSALGSGTNHYVYALAVSGGDLYAGGFFTAAGEVNANYIAKWNGSAWSALGSGMNHYVYALAVNGSDLYAGGRFATAGGVSASAIAKWNGSAWSNLGSGIYGQVYALAVSAGGLYAGGYFTAAGGVSANHIAKWSGSTWSPLGSGLDYDVGALAISGADLYAGGNFTTAGGVSVNDIAKWTGSTWSALGSGIGGDYYNGYYYPNVNALAVSDSYVYVGGIFTLAGGKVSPYLAKLQLSAPPVITQISPNPIPAIDGPQPLTIFGQRFDPACTVTLRDHRTGEVYPDRTKFSQSATQITLNPNFGSAPAEWSVEVINSDAKSSGQVPFQVGSPMRPGITVDSLVVAGEASLPAGGRHTYSAELHYQDGSKAQIGNHCEWRIATPAPAGTALIGPALFTGAVQQPTTVVLSASYTNTGGRIHSQPFQLTITPSLMASINRPVVDPASGTVGLTATAWGGVGDISFQWDLDGDGIFDDGSGATLSRSYPGFNYTKRFKVLATDQSGAQAEAMTDCVFPVAIVLSEPGQKSFPSDLTPGIWSQLNGNGELSNFVADPSKKMNGLIVITHGLTREDEEADGQRMWMQTMASKIKSYTAARGIEPNILVYDWTHDANPSARKGFDRDFIDYQTYLEGYPSTAGSTHAVVLLGTTSQEEFLVDVRKIKSVAQHHGAALGQEIANLITTGVLAPPSAYSPVHLIGHSAGGFVIGECAEELRRSGFPVDMITTLDTPYLDPGYKPSPGSRTVLERYITQFGALSSYYELQGYTSQGTLSLLPATIQEQSRFADSSTYRRVRWSRGISLTNFEKHSDAHRRYTSTIPLPSMVTIPNELRDGFFHSPYVQYSKIGQTPASPVGGLAASSLEPDEPGQEPATGASEAIAAEWTTFGSVEVMPNGYRFSEQANAGISSTVAIPFDALTLDVDVAFEQPGDGDYLLIMADGVPFHLIADTASRRTSAQTERISVGALAGRTVLLTVKLVSRGQVNAVARIENLAFTEIDDPDGDGLLTADEIALGTDPLRFDTDEDWLGDGEEASGATDPLVWDTDGDGIGDGAEGIAGTNPADSASRFVVTRTARDSQGHILITWASVPGKQYAILRSDTPSFETYVTLETRLEATTSTSTYTDAAVPAGSDVRVFYRVVVDG